MSLILGDADGPTLDEVRKVPPETFDTREKVQKRKNAVTLLILFLQTSDYPDRSGLIHRYKQELVRLNDRAAELERQGLQLNARRRVGATLYYQ